MECYSRIMVSEYFFEWKCVFNRDAPVRQAYESDYFYAGSDRETTWRMEFIPHADSSRAGISTEFKLILIHGSEVRVSGEITYVKQGKIIGKSNIPEQVLCASMSFNVYKSLVSNAEISYNKKDSICCSLRIIGEEFTLPYVRRVEDFNAIVTDIGSLLSHQKHTDVSIVSQDGQEFRSHKSILSARSEVFAAMFDNDMVENLEGRVDISDMNGCDVEEMLRYIYSGNFSNWSQRLCENLLVVADKYKVKGMKEACAKYLTNMMNISSAARVITLADLHNDATLKNSALNFILRNGKEVLNTPEWKILVKEYPHLVDEVFSEMLKHVRF